jgi:pyruvate formate lyase activating enzyme
MAHTTPKPPAPPHAASEPSSKELSSSAHNDMLRVHSIETLGTHEGPGIRLVIFLQGCHLRCLYCHNPDTWALEGGSLMSVPKLLELLEREKPYFGSGGGLTVSGGEPLIQRKPLRELFRRARAKGFNTTLDTNGSILDDAAKDLLEETDLVLLDIKHIDDEAHKELTGVSNYVPLRFAEYLRSIGKPFWLRYVLVPGRNDTNEQLERWAATFKDYESLQRVEILPYHTLGVYKYKELGIPYPLKGMKPPSRETIERAERVFGKYFEKVVVR